MADRRLTRAAVIGSGFGGLAAAIRLQTAGVPTTIFEARDLPGGRAYVYRDGGYTFDAGPTVITAPHCLEELWAEAGRRLADDVELLPVTPFYRLHWLDDGHTMDYDGKMDSMVAQIAARAPGDVDGYERSRDYSAKVFDAGLHQARVDAVSALLGHGQGRAAARPAARRSLGVRHRRPLREGRARPPGAVVPLAPGRRQPLRDLVDLHADPPPRAHLGRVVRQGRHRRAGARRWSSCSPSWAARSSCRRRSTASASRTAPTVRHHVTARGATTGLRSGRVQRRRPQHLRQALRRGAAGQADGEEARARRLVDVAVRPVLRHRPVVRGSRSPTTPWCSASATRSS
jgi:hypothetical protein